MASTAFCSMRLAVMLTFFPQPFRLGYGVVQRRAERARMSIALSGSPAAFSCPHLCQYNWNYSEWLLHASTTVSHSQRSGSTKETNIRWIAPLTTPSGQILADAPAKSHSAHVGSGGAGCGVLHHYFGADSLGSDLRPEPAGY